jgi:basic amino acid/polyamine antiporter, APA family
MATPSASGPAAVPGVSLTTATAVTVANMIGTGVFTSLGFQVVDVESGFSLLLVWILGGVFALCGALSYGELAAAMPRSGGEYHFLGRIYHPAVGFLSGWISLTVGFAAPIALAAMAFGRYAGRVVDGLSPVAVSCGVVVLVTLAHLRDLRLGSAFQNLFTIFKVTLILVFIGAAFGASNPRPIDFAPGPADLEIVLGAPFAIALLFVMYSYSGWNASTYIMDEVRDSAVTVPRSLILGTLLVTVLYVGLNWAFLAVAPIDELAGKVEVGHVAAVRVFGEGGGRLMSAMLCVALVSSISAMTWAGPRVTQVMGQDLAAFRFLARTNAAGIPWRAVLLQSAIVVVLLVTATFEQVLVYIQLTLTLSLFLTVLGVFVSRWKHPDLPRPYKTWGYPLTPLLFLAIGLFTLGYTLKTRPLESLAGLLTVLAGLPIYLLSPKNVKELS